MDEMVERVARSLCEREIRIARRWDTRPEQLEAMMPKAIDANWGEFTDQARVSIMAMREPTETMMEAPRAALVTAGTDFLMNTWEAREAWVHMIDEALK